MGIRPDPYEAVAQFYDLEHQNFGSDVDFYLQTVQDGPVLEVGVGTGRVMLPLLEAGFDVWGVDTSPAMLSRATPKTEGFPKSHLVQASVLEMGLDVLFRSALMPLNTLWHLPSSDEQVAALRSIQRHLDQDGLLILDLSNPFTLPERGSWGEVRQRLRCQMGEESVMGWSASWDDEAAQTLRMSLTYDRARSDGRVQRSLSEFILRYVYAGELSLMLLLAGFAKPNLFGSYELDAYSAASPNLIAVTHRT
jgi:SAM-dependent methyltransferase